MSDKDKLADAVAAMKCSSIVDGCRDVMENLSKIILSADTYHHPGYTSTQECFEDMEKKLRAIATKMAKFGEREPTPDQNATRDEFVSQCLKRLGACCEFAARRLGRGLGK